MEIKSCSMTYHKNELSGSMEDPELLPSMMTIIVTVTDLTETQHRAISSGILDILSMSIGIVDR